MISGMVKVLCKITDQGSLFQIQLSCSASRQVTILPKLRRSENNNTFEPGEARTPKDMTKYDDINCIRRVSSSGKDIYLSLAVLAKLHKAPP
jgi:hypothetical protein